MRKRFAALVLIGMIVTAPADAAGRMFNFRFNPLPLVAGIALQGFILPLEFDVAVSDRFTVGAMVGFGEISESDADGGSEISVQGYGIRANWYMSGGAIGDSWILAPWFSYIPVTGTGVVIESGIPVGVEGVNHARNLGLQIAYQWVWGSGINLTLGLGIMSISIPSEIELTGCAESVCSIDTVQVPGASNIPSILPNIEFSLGFAF